VGTPRASQYCSASFIADSTASEPLDEYTMCPNCGPQAREKQGRQLLKWFAGKEVAVTARHLSKLLDDRRVDLAVTVTGC